MLPEKNSNKTSDQSSQSTKQYSGKRPSVVPSTEVIIRKFFREVQQSDIMTEIKLRRNFQKKSSRNKRRSDAKARNLIRERYQQII